MNNMNPNPEAPPKFTVQQLSQLIQLIENFNGKIKQLKVSQEVLDWYRDHKRIVVKSYGIPTTKNHAKDEFMGVELVTE